MRDVKDTAVSLAVLVLTLGALMGFMGDNSAAEKLGCVVVFFVSVFVWNLHAHHSEQEDNTDNW